jgi:hypothetical protein
MLVPSSVVRQLGWALQVCQPDLGFPGRQQATTEEQQTQPPQKWQSEEAGAKMGRMQGAEEL